MRENSEYDEDRSSRRESIANRKNEEQTRPEQNTSFGQLRQQVTERSVVEPKTLERCLLRQTEEGGGQAARGAKAETAENPRVRTQQREPESHAERREVQGMATSGTQTNDELKDGLEPKLNMCDRDEDGRARRRDDGEPQPNPAKKSAGPDGGEPQPDRAKVSSAQEQTRSPATRAPVPPAAPMAPRVTPAHETHLQTTPRAHPSTPANQRPNPTGPNAAPEFDTFTQRQRPVQVDLKGPGLENFGPQGILGQLAATTPSGGRQADIPCPSPVLVGTPDAPKEKPPLTRRESAPSSSLTGPGLGSFNAQNILGQGGAGCPSEETNTAQPSPTLPATSSVNEYNPFTGRWDPPGFNNLAGSGLESFNIRNILGQRAIERPAEAANPRPLPSQLQSANDAIARFETYRDQPPSPPSDFTSEPSESDGDSSDGDHDVGYGPHGAYTPPTPLGNSLSGPDHGQNPSKDDDHGRGSRPDDADLGPGGASDNNDRLNPTRNHLIKPQDNGDASDSEDASDINVGEFLGPLAAGDSSESDRGSDSPGENTDEDNDSDDEGSGLGPGSEPGSLGYASASDPLGSKAGSRAPSPSNPPPAPVAEDNACNGGGSVPGGNQPSDRTPNAGDVLRSSSVLAGGTPPSALATGNQPPLSIAANTGANDPFRLGGILAGGHQPVPNTAFNVDTNPPLGRPLEDGSQQSNLVPLGRTPAGINHAPNTAREGCPPVQLPWIRATNAAPVLGTQFQNYAASGASCTRSIYQRGGVFMRNFEGKELGFCREEEETEVPAQGPRAALTRRPERNLGPPVVWRVRGRALRQGTTPPARRNPAGLIQNLYRSNKPLKGYMASGTSCSQTGGVRVFRAPDSPVPSNRPHLTRPFQRAIEDQVERHAEQNPFEPSSPPPTAAHLPPGHWHPEWNWNDGRDDTDEVGIDMHCQPTAQGVDLDDYDESQGRLEERIREARTAAPATVEAAGFVAPPARPQGANRPQRRGSFTRGAPASQRSTPSSSSTRARIIRPRLRNPTYPSRPFSNICPSPRVPRPRRSPPDSPRDTAAQTFRGLPGRVARRFGSCIIRRGLYPISVAACLIAGYLASVAVHGGESDEVRWYVTRGEAAIWQAGC